jgi:hypothetical protein
VFHRLAGIDNALRRDDRAFVTSEVAVLAEGLGNH